MTPSSPIPLPYTAKSALQVLSWGTHPEDVDAPPEIEKLLPVLKDVETQWDLFLANTYSLKDLQTKSLEDICMPAIWFEEWLVKAKTCG